MTTTVSLQLLQLSLTYELLSSVVIASRDFDDVIYIFIWNMEKKDPPHP